MFKAQCLLFLMLLYVVPATSEPLGIMQAKSYSSDINGADYYVSEKLDGVRARWNGTNLVSRNGNVFSAPDWFVKDFPAAILDGELWLGRGQYQQTVSVVSRHKPHDGWQQIKFMVFDLPANPLPFAGKAAQLQQLINPHNSPYLHSVEQRRVSNHAQLMALFDTVIKNGGEGLMLHHGDAHYVAGRSASLLKLKKFDDAEAVVIGYKPGKGKYLGMLGSLRLRAPDGREFYVGSGLSDEVRANPPPLAALITYRHQGFTNAGLPRFPVYLRQRTMP